MTVYAAFDHRFQVTCDHAGLDARLAVVLAPLESTPNDGTLTRDATCAAAPGRVDLEADAPTYRLVVDRGRPGPFELWRDDEPLVRSDHPALPYARLLQQINRHANRTASLTATVLHSAAAQAPAGPVLLPAPMEAGKSTLVAELVRRGWGYLTDELVALEPDTLAVRAFPRAISLDQGSWRLFPELAPQVDEATRWRLPAQWQVPAASFGHVAIDGLRPAAVVTHHYRPKLQTELTELDAVECLRRLIQCCFSFDDYVERDLNVLSSLLEHVPCYELVVGDLFAARDALVEAFGTLTPPDDAPR